MKKFTTQQILDAAIVAAAVAVLAVGTIAIIKNCKKALKNCKDSVDDCIDENFKVEEEPESEIVECEDVSEIEISECCEEKNECCNETEVLNNIEEINQ